jgi:hypothetical protein
LIDSHLLTFIVTAIFFAGNAWLALKLVRKQSDETLKQLNGLGAGTRRRERNLILALMVITERREDREVLADFFRE